MTEPNDDILDRFVRRTKQIGGFPEPAMRRAAIDETLRNLEPQNAVWWLDQLIRGALWGKGPDLDAMIACADWLIRVRSDDDYELFTIWFQAATESERESVLFLLRDPPPHQALVAGAKLPQVRLPMTRDTTMGERRTMARGQNREVWSRLLADPDPLVLTEVLKNPSLQATDVVQTAARRPTTVSLIDAVIAHPRWFRESIVREAVARNPYARTGTALRLLPTLNITILRQLRNSGDLHPMVHKFSELLIELREIRTAPWRV